MRYTLYGDKKILLHKDTGYYEYYPRKSFYRAGREVEPHHEQCPGDGIDLDKIKEEVEK